VQAEKAGHLPGLPEIETSATNDELTCSLIETFTASDPPAWIVPARVGTSSNNAVVRRKQQNIPDRHYVELSL
jgi:hypothetical protein